MDKNEYGEASKKIKIWGRGERRGRQVKGRRGKKKRINMEGKRM